MAKASGSYKKSKESQAMKFRNEQPGSWTIIKLNHHKRKVNPKDNNKKDISKKNWGCIMMIDQRYNCWRTRVRLIQRFGNHNKSGDPMTKSGSLKAIRAATNQVYNNLTRTTECKDSLGH